MLSSNRRRLLAATLSGTALSATVTLPRLVQAQALSDRPIRIMVGLAAGGANDTLARLIARHLGDVLGQSVVVENRPGASGTIAGEIVAKAAPDGHTLLLGSIGTNAFVPILRKNMPYDNATELKPVSLVGQAGAVLTVRADLPAKSVAELVQLAKAQPGKFTFGSSGNGTSLHIAGELFKFTAGVDLLHVPYKGNAPALNAVSAGEIDVLFSAPLPVLPLVKAGKVRMLGVSTPKRLIGLEDVPTIAESGVPGYAMASWYGLFASHGTPDAVADRLASETRKILARDDVRSQILAQGIEPVGSTPAEFQDFVTAESSKWTAVFKAANITLE